MAARRERERVLTPPPLNHFSADCDRGGEYFNACTREGHATLSGVKVQSWVEQGVALVIIVARGNRKC